MQTSIDRMLNTLVPKKEVLSLIRGFLYMSILILTSYQAMSQSRVTGVFFQAVARDNAFNPAKDRNVFVQTSIIQTTANGNVVLTEMHQSKTDASGVFSINIGQGTRLGGSAASMISIDWSKGPFFLNVKLAIVPVAPLSGWNYSNELVDVGTTSFGAVPYAYYAEKTGSSDLQLNLSDTSKMLSVYVRSQLFLDSIITINTRTNLKLNSGDTAAMLKGYATISRMIDSLNVLRSNADLKLNIADTAKMLSNRFKRDTASLSARINANKKGITDSVLSLRSSIEIITLAIQYVDGKNTNAIIDTARSIRLELSDTANALRSLSGGNLADSAFEIRTALLDSAEDIRAALLDSLSDTRLALLDTAVDIRVALLDSSSAIRVALLDSAVDIRLALLDTARDIRVALLDSLSATRLALLDTAVDIRIALLDSAGDIRIALVDSAGDIRNALLDTATDLRSYANQKVNISDTALMLSNRFARDTVSLSNRINAANTRVTDSSTALNGRINLKVNIADTSGMLVPYLRKIDTSAMLSNRFARDTVSLSNRIVAANKGVVDSSANLNTRINLKVNIADTSGMLVPYLRKVDTSAMLSNRFARDTVSLSNRIVAANKGVVDSSANLNTRINLKVNIADTSGMLVPYLRKVDTSAMLSNRFARDTVSLSNRIVAANKGVVDSSANLNTRINLKVNIADTSGMLVPYLRKVDTSAMLSNRFARDTVSLSNRIVAANKGVVDSSANLNTRINLKVNIADTATMLTPYFRKAGILPIANGGTGTANGSITGTSALTFAAGGTNENVTITPKGTGNTVLNGNVGVGTSSPNAKLDIRTSPTSTTDPGAGYIGLGTTSTAAGSAGAGALRYSTSSGGILEYSNGTAWNTLSSTVTKSTVVASKLSTQTINDMTATDVTGWTGVVDNNNTFDESTGVFTAPRSGNYVFTFSYAFTGSDYSATPSVIEAWMSCSDGNKLRKQLLAAPISALNQRCGALISFVVNLTVSETLKPVIWHNTGIPRSLEFSGGGSGFINLSIVEL